MVSFPFIRGVMGYCPREGYRSGGNSIQFLALPELAGPAGVRADAPTCPTAEMMNIGGPTARQPVSRSAEGRVKD